jgi:AcrR family transcriptional regulator
MSDLNAPAPFAKRTYGGISGEERSRQRREKLLESSLDVFGTLGHDKATMRDICAHARLAERYFYENFANTVEAFEAVYLMLSRELFEALTRALSTAPEGHAMSKAAACLRTYFSFIKEDPRRAQIMLLDAPRLGHNNIHQPGSTMAEYARFMVGIVRGHQAELPADVNLDLVTTGLIGLAAQTGITWYHSDFKASIEQLVEHNLYAWHGLAHWLERQSAHQAQTA